MARIAFIGAGSGVFCRRICSDILLTPGLEGSTIILMDINAARLRLSHALVRKLVQQNRKNVRVEATANRKRALDGADAVVVAIEVGGREAIYDDYMIPKKYGMKQTVADTTGPGGLFRFIRIAPVLLDICRDMERLCPRAILLNYSNPMCLNMTAIQQASPVQSLGLCHSIQELTGQLSRAIQKPEEELVIRSAGVNHTAWFYRFEWGGKDAYPLLRAALRKDPDVMGPVQRLRVDLFENFGLFPTEGPYHHAEYHPYYLKSDEEIERFGVRLDSYLRGLDEREARHLAEMKRLVRDPKEHRLNRSTEYASAIIDSSLTYEKPTRIHASVMNKGLIGNLPSSVSVEVPIFIDHTGINPTITGDLPPGPAGRTAALAYTYDCGARGYLGGDRELIYQAMLLDPNTSAQLTTRQIRMMVRDMFRANEDRLRKLGSALARQKSAPKASNLRRRASL